MGDAEACGSILSWDEYDVHLWLSKLGFPQYEVQMREHHITGDILTQLDHEMLKEIGVATLGQRLTILRAIYQLKLAHCVEIGPGHYVPPCDYASIQIIALRSILTFLIAELGCEDERHPRLKEHAKSGKQLKIAEKVSNWLKDHVDSDLAEVPGPSPLILTTNTEPCEARSDRTEDSIANQLQEQVICRHGSPPPLSTASSVCTGPPDAPQKRKIGLNDAVWKVLPAALRKYKISDDWQNYAMFICYGQTERRLALDEKPLLIFKKLKEEQQNPVFVLKHITEAHKGNDCGVFVKHGACAERPDHQISFAVAIFPFKTGRGGAFDVVPGDSFIVLSRNKIRWVVQRDPTGTGVIDDIHERGRVPPGCLLETDVPIAVATAAACAAQTSSGLSPSKPVGGSSSAPILPVNVLSEGFVDLVQTGHEKLDESGLDLTRGDVVHVYKRYKHLSYVMKESGDRGWVPSWLLSKDAQCAKQDPLTPASTVCST
ncbi:hypothetical protein M0805_008760 [Coniferiporia weirii]|nr:hypothetical protein M0805_008760 [Coniferiporia weirii]